MDQLLFASEVVVNGLMTGVMYSLVALGFVLIYKASGVFNYAQGVMALFAALTLVGIMEGQVPFAHLINAIFGTHLSHFGWTVPSVLAIVLTAGVMVLLAILIEKLVLKHLVGQEPIILFMATIGLAYFLEGLGDVMWGADIKTLDVGLPQGISDAVEQTTANWFGYGFFIDRLDIWATVIAALLVAALVAGIMWGTKSGVQFSLSLIALKALPVLMLGGFTSIPGAIVGGLIIGVGEKLFEFFVGPMVGGATENWFAYVLALIFLVFRPQGLFGERIIERV